ncbi:MAG: hypothetical protein WBD22_12210 [Pyrinomonadaceae bacterium]
MKRKIKLGFVTAAFVALIACGFSSDKTSGVFEGTMKLSKVNYGSNTPDIFDSGLGDIRFPSRDRLRFGANTPLPDCNLSISKTQDSAYQITSMTQFKGESNDGKGCQAVIFSGSEMPVFVEGSVKLAASGEVVVTAFLYREDSPDTNSYEIQFRGRKKGWF